MEEANTIGGVLVGAIFSLGTLAALAGCVGVIFPGVFSFVQWWLIIIGAALLRRA